MAGLNNGICMTRNAVSGGALEAEVETSGESEVVVCH